jgi:DNA-binding SARP family transcriptional activator
MFFRPPQILLFGGLRFCSPQGTSSSALTGVARELLAYLCAHSGKDLRRERVAELFWPDLDQARSRAALNTAVWRVNKALREQPDLSLRSTPEVLVLTARLEITSDVQQFESAVRRGLDAIRGDGRLSTEMFTELARAVDLCEAPFLDGYNAEWAVIERERLLSLQLRGLGLLMQDRGLARDYEGALEYGARILALDPFREQAQCEVMWLHVLSGQRARALKQYRAYRSLLAREMGIEPMAEMRALAAHVQEDPDAEQEVAGGGGEGSGQALADLLQSVSRARLGTYRTLQAN